MLTALALRVGHWSSRPVSVRRRWLSLTFPVRATVRSTVQIKFSFAKSSRVRTSDQRVAGKIPVPFGTAIGSKAASKSSADAPLKPFKSSFAPSGQGERAGDLIVRMVRVPEGFGARTGPGHTFDGRISILHQRVEQDLMRAETGAILARQ